MTFMVVTRGGLKRFAGGACGFHLIIQDDNETYVPLSEPAACRADPHHRRAGIKDCFSPRLSDGPYGAFDTIKIAHALVLGATFGNGYRLREGGGGAAVGAACHR